MTHPTKAIYGSLMRDFARLATSREEAEKLFDETDVRNSLNRIEVVDFHQNVDINGIKVDSSSAAEAHQPTARWLQQEVSCLLIQ